MIDFMLNDSGDISFSKIEQNNSELQFDFFICNNSALFFDFYVENYKDPKYLKGLTPGLILNFSTNKINYDKEIDYNVDEEDYLYQQLKIRVSSSLNTILGNKDIGSNVEFYRHRNIEDNLDNILSSVKEAITHILPDAKISIIKTKTNYYDYSNTLKITISNKKYNFYYYL